VISSVGRAAPLQGVGRRFEPVITHHRFVGNVQSSLKKCRVISENPQSYWLCGFFIACELSGGVQLLPARARSLSVVFFVVFSYSRESTIGYTTMSKTALHQFTRLEIVNAKAAPRPYTLVDGGGSMHWLGPTAGRVVAPSCMCTHLMRNAISFLESKMMAAAKKICFSMLLIAMSGGYAQAAGDMTNVGNGALVQSANGAGTTPPGAVGVDDGVRASVGLRE
jgi:hypothetical protein